MRPTLDVPVALFMFKRLDKTLKVLERIASASPKRLYLLSDGGRTPEEAALVAQCRHAVEMAITWDCEIVRHYRDTNVGVYENIAGGARWVLGREERAIFLEDDNLPEVTFFQFCQEMLERFSENDEVLWVCGTNYLGDCESVVGASYQFTQCMLPCGWASWSAKFSKAYDGELKHYSSATMQRTMNRYPTKGLFLQDRYNIEHEIDHKTATGRFYSWDYQMSFSLRHHDLLGVIPSKNQITNIGNDVDATHGGNDSGNVMVQRFCGIPTLKLNFPLVHPQAVAANPILEKKLADIIVDPAFLSLRSRASRAVRSALKIPKHVSIRSHFGI